MHKDETVVSKATDPQRWSSQEPRNDDLRQRIEARAYEIYQARGAEPGHDLDDWVQAESEVTKQTTLHRAA